MKKTKENYGRASIIIVFVILGLIVLNVILGAILAFEKLHKKNATQQLKEVVQETNIAANDKVALNTYIGMDGCFLGSYENGKWYNAQKSNEDIEINHKEFTLNDIKKIQKFYYHKYGSHPIEYSDYIEYEGTMDDTFRFKIPETIDENKDTIGIITVNKQNIFEVDNMDNIITHAYDDIINEVKKNNNVEKVETEISKCISADYDEDGMYERILLINTVTDSHGYVNSKNGVCVFVIAIDDDRSYQVIYKNTIAREKIKNIQDVENQIGVRSAVICDLNVDGNCELCVDAYTWDVPTKMVYEFNEKENKFVLRLSGTFPW